MSNDFDTRDLIKEKREKFTVNIRKQRREADFNMKRQQLFQDNLQQIELPLFSESFKAIYQEHTQFIQNVYETASQHVIGEGYRFQPENTQESYIWHIVTYKNFLYQHEFIDSQVAQRALEIIFQVIGKGLPRIEQICLDIIQQVSFMQTHNAQLLMKSSYLNQLKNLFQTTEYLAIREQCMIVFRNLAGDCQEFRDQIYYAQILEMAFDYIVRGGREIEIISEVIYLLYNFVMQPKLAQNQKMTLVQPIVFLFREFASTVNAYDKKLMKVMLRTLSTILKDNQSLKEHYTYELVSQLVDTLQDVDFSQQIDVLIILNIVSFISKESFTIDFQLKIVKNIYQGFIYAAQASSEVAVQQYIKTIYSFCADGPQIVNIFVEKEFWDSAAKIQEKLSEKTRDELAHLYEVIIKSGSDDQLKRIFEYQDCKIFRCLVGLLDCESPTTLETVLNTIRHFFQRGKVQDEKQAMRDKDFEYSGMIVYEVFLQEGGFDILAKLERHQSQRVYNATSSLLDLFD